MIKRRILITLLLFTFLPALAIPGNSDSAYAELYINEFMADNDNTIEDPDDPNNFEDWIEIYNSGNSTVGMGGMYLTDDLADPTKWQIPAGVTIPAGGYLLFWADNDEEQGDNHAGFGLARNGEEIGLFGADGVTLVDSVTFGVQIMDVSYGRYPEGTDNWGLMTASPGTANTPHNAPPVITDLTHSPRSPSEEEPVWVTCTVTDDGEVMGVTLIYNAGSGLVNISMHDDGAHNDAGISDGLFGAQISSFAKDTIVDYYVSATDNLGTVSNAPIGAPSLTVSYIVGYLPPQLFINEFMADNDSIIEDPDDPNNFEDWIEIYNAGDSILDMGGMYLTDKLANPTQWRIPDGIIIPAGGYLLFWADNDEEQGNTHTSFGMAAGGEEIGLFDIDAKRNMAINTMTFGEQPTDISCGRIYDGDEPWVLSENATPGYANAFPLGTHPIIWSIALTVNSYDLMKEMRDCVSAIKKFDVVSGKRESAYLFWGKPSGCNFTIESGQSYLVSLTFPCYFPFK